MGSKPMNVRDDRSYLDHPLERGLPPSWVSSWGDSKYGPWVGFEVGGVEQRLYWIWPGTFTMGSPEDEPGREDTEVQHQVTLTRGFWMAETPVTQGLWEAVMGANPSRFVDSRRPVEQVSWDAVQEFIGRLNDKQPGLHVRLPTEAEWEYCCRAGTETATHAGPIEIHGHLQRTHSRSHRLVRAATAAWTSILRNTRTQQTGPRSNTHTQRQALDA